VSPRLRRRLSIAAGLLVLGLIYLAGLLAFGVQRDTGQKKLRIGNAREGIGIGARVIGVNPAEDAMTIRLEFAPLGSYRTGEILLNRAIDIFVSTSKGRSVLHFPADSVMSPTEATVSLLDGEVLDYPFDSYHAALVIFAADSRGNNVPISEEVSTGFNGFRINKSTANYHGYPYAKFHLRRATTTIFFAVFIMLVFWAVALSAFALAVMLAERKRRFEAGFTGFLAALLFALPTVRNNLPGSPPIGSLNDFLAFFWTEGICALALVIVVVAWVVRRLPGAAPPAG
jgi:hypothetical protein